MGQQSTSRKYQLLIAVVVVLADRFTKELVARSIALYDSISVVPGFFRLTHLQNRGAAFGLFDDSPSQWKITLLVVFSLAALVVVAAMLWKSGQSLNASGVGLSLVLGGAVGNLWDRLSSHYVIDFLDVYFRTYHWPAFNVADSAIVVGAFLLVIDILLVKHPEREKAA